MHAKPLAAALVIAIVCTPSSKADLVSEFVGLALAWDVGVPASPSSCRADETAGVPVSGSIRHDFLQDLGPPCVSPRCWVGEAPSPGGDLWRDLDQGVRALNVQDGSLVIKLATDLNPLEGLYHGGREGWSGQTDVFHTIQETHAINHYGLLSASARDAFGDPRLVSGSRSADALALHTPGGASGTNLDGQLTGRPLPRTPRSATAASPATPAIRRRAATYGASSRGS